MGTLPAILASPHFLTDLSNSVLLLLLYFLIPWTAINLTDYYLVRRGRYVINDKFRVDGRYGAVNWWGELPFINSNLYVGPIARALGGADISWSLGFLLAGALYYLAATRLSASGRTEHAATAR